MRARPNILDYNPYDEEKWPSARAAYVAWVQDNQMWEADNTRRQLYKRAGLAIAAIGAVAGTVLYFLH